MNPKPTHPKNAALNIILVSLAFAALMLLASYGLGKSEQKSTVIMLIVAVWWIPYSYYCARVGFRCNPNLTDQANHQEFDK